MKSALTLESSLFLCNQNTRLPLERMNLLRALGNTGSITKAAKECNLSYKAAWDSLHALQNLMDFPLFTTEIGGKGGGGSKLTAESENLLLQWEQFVSVHEQVLEALKRVMGSKHDLSPLSRLVLQTSARNQISGQVKAITEVGLRAEIQIDIGADSPITAQITKDSLSVMGLRDGTAVLCLIKASSVQMFKETNYRAIAESNRIRGQVIYSGQSESQAEVQIKCSDTQIIVASLGSEEFEILKPSMNETLIACIPQNSIILATLSN